jgi:two-component system sensor histidine kinase PilS (NtrC family)
MGIIAPAGNTDVFMDAFKIGFHTLGFVAVAYLGTRLNLRLHVMERALDEKTESLAQLYRLNDHIVSSIRSGLITTDLAGRVTVFNAAAREMTGKNPKEVLGASVCGIIGEAFWELIRETELSRKTRPIRHEAWIQLSDGSMRFFGFTVSPLLDAKNKHLGYIISFQDLSEIVRLEKEVQLRERLSAVGRMAAVVAHEIRNPLTAMRGSVEILRARTNLPEKDERLLNILISESDRLDSFIENFLNFAIPKPQPKTVLDIVPILHDSVTLIKNSPEIKGKYSVSLDVETPDMLVLGNADQIRQVFWNVTQNAMRAMPEGGNLTIRADKTTDDAGKVTFIDSGIGMTPEEIEQIFQPFHSGFSKGLGLGLSVIFHIMEDHHGNISFESEKGKGTKVILSFPPARIFQGDSAAPAAE